MFNSLVMKFNLESVNLVYSNKGNSNYQASVCFNLINLALNHIKTDKSKKM